MTSGRDTYPPPRRRSDGVANAATTLSAAAIVAACLLVAGCMTRPPAPVVDRSPATTRGESTTSNPTTQSPQPLPEPPPTHTVKRGETLYQIALDHGLDYRELAAWNNIENVNVIRVGRVLVLAAPGATIPQTQAQSTAADGTGAASGGAGGGATTSPLIVVPSVAAVGGTSTNGPASGVGETPAPSGRNTLAYKSEPKALKVPYSERAFLQAQQGGALSSSSATAPTAQAAPSAASMTIPPAPAAPAPPAASAPAPAPARTDSARVPEIDDSVEWAWPTSGKVVSTFSDTANLKGIDIAGKAGQAVLASGAGKVVYAGSGLRGYGKLIIIKHNNTFLSAYAHNREILVKEGQQVTKGQKIAEMGDTDADQVKLHFEIRRLGKPIDPVKYLPPA